ncbi:MAG: hypothetical protein JNM22_15950 [Saprospiraceae bacterium]|nr:hypothetical protein [Saprospiraceae bacterium]
MGAEQPKQEKTGTEAPPRKMYSIRVLALVILAGALILRIAFPNEGEVPNLRPKDAARLEKKLREIDDAEQYALVARSDGLYACLNGPPTYYLKTGEVWRYGVTTKGELGRYKGKFLIQNNVIYTVQFRGNIAECLKQEQIKLFMYPYLPENLARPIELRLPRPPYNPIMN